MISNNQTGIILSIYLKHIFVISISEISIYNSKYNAIQNVSSVVRAREWATEIRHKLFVLTEALPFLAPPGSLWLDLLFSLDLTGSLTHSLAPYSPLWLSLWLPLALIASVALARHVSKYSAWLKRLFKYNTKLWNTVPNVAWIKKYSSTYMFTYLLLISYHWILIYWHLWNNFTGDLSGTLIFSLPR